METIELKSKAIKGSIWALFEKFSIQFMQFVVAVVLARILNPKDFGLIVLATIFSGVSGAIADAGFEKTIVQKKEILPIQIDTIFYINVSLGALLTITLFLLAPFIANFFHEPNLTSVLRCISVGTFINSLSQVQRTLLMKELNFRKISLAQIISSFGGGVTGLSLAILGYGVWALVFSILSAQLILFLVFWIKSSWYPSFRFSYLSIRGMLPYGLNILFSSIFFFFIQQFSNLIIGKYYPGKDLGLVNRGNKTPEMITSTVQSVIVKIAFPFFAKVQDNPIVLGNELKRLVQTIAFFSFPLLFLLFANATDITVLLFTKKWIGSVIFLQFYCIIKLFDPIVSLFREVILAKGDAKVLSKALTITSIVEVILIFSSVTFGLRFIMVALLISMIFQYLFYSVILSSRLFVGIAEQLSWMVPYLILSFLAALSCFLFEHLTKNLDISIIIRLLVKLLIGVTTYITGICLLRVNEASYFKLQGNSLAKYLK